MNAARTGPSRVASVAVHFDALASSGRTVVVEVRVYPVSEWVEIWHTGMVVGTFRSNTLSGWLADPTPQPLQSFSTSFSLDRTVDRNGRVAITLPEVALWTLAPETLADIRRALRPRRPRQDPDLGQDLGQIHAAHLHC